MTVIQFPYKYLASKPVPTFARTEKATTPRPEVQMNIDTDSVV